MVRARKTAALVTTRGNWLGMCASLLKATAPQASKLEGPAARAAGGASSDVESAAATRTIHVARRKRKFLVGRAHPGVRPQMARGVCAGRWWARGAARTWRGAARTP